MIVISVCGVVVGCLSDNDEGSGRTIAIDGWDNEFLLQVLTAQQT